MTRYLLMMAMVILTPPKGSGGMPLAPKPAVIEARVWDKLAAALSFVESRNDDRAYNAIFRGFRKMANEKGIR